MTAATARDLPTLQTGEIRKGGDTIPAYLRRVHSPPVSSAFAVWAGPQFFTLPGTGPAHTAAKTGRRSGTLSALDPRVDIHGAIYERSKPSILGQEWSSAGPGFRGGSVRAVRA